jgi:hypothetical protein
MTQSSGQPKQRGSGLISAPASDVDSLRLAASESRRSRGVASGPRSATVLLPAQTPIAAEVVDLLLRQHAVAAPARTGTGLGRAAVSRWQAQARLGSALSTSVRSALLRRLDQAVRQVSGALATCKSLVALIPQQP